MIPSLPLSQRDMGSSNEELTDRTFATKFITKREGALNMTMGAKQTRKLLTTRNDPQNSEEQNKLSSTRLKKFSRVSNTTSGSNYSQKSQALAEKISKFETEEQMSGEVKI